MATRNRKRTKRGKAKAGAKLSKKAQPAVRPLAGASFGQR
jgi:hypothetical protein